MVTSTSPNIVGDTEKNSCKKTMRCQDSIDTQQIINLYRCHGRVSKDGGLGITKAVDKEKIFASEDNKVTKLH